MKLRHSSLQFVERAHLVRREGAIEEGEVVEQADVVASPQTNAGLLDIPGEALVNPARRALVLRVEVEARPTRLGGIEAVPGDYNVRPLPFGERRLRDFDQAEEEALIAFPLTGHIPLALVPKASQPEVGRCVVLREVGPDAGIAEILIGKLERIAVALRKLSRINTQPE